MIGTKARVQRIEVTTGSEKILSFLVFPGRAPMEILTPSMNLFSGAHLSQSETRLTLVRLLFPHPSLIGIFRTLDATLSQGRWQVRGARAFQVAFIIYSTILF